MLIRIPIPTLPFCSIHIFPLLFLFLLLLFATLGPTITVLRIGGHYTLELRPQRLDGGEFVADLACDEGEVSWLQVMGVWISRIGVGKGWDGVRCVLLTYGYDALEVAVQRV
jgi:hypothetical protein